MKKAFQIRFVSPSPSNSVKKVRIILALICFTLSACGAVPYVELGAGARLESGDYFVRPGVQRDSGTEIDEVCFLIHVGGGLAWPGGMELRADHRSCMISEPEITTNQILLIKRLNLR